RYVSGRVQRLYTPRNRWTDGTKPAGNRGFEPGLAGLQSIIRDGERDNMRVRGVGSGWSLSRAPFVNDYLVNTTMLSAWSVGLSEKMVTPAYQDRRARLVFA